MGNPSTIKAEKAYLSPADLQRYKLIIKSNLWKNVGIVRDKAGLESALKMIDEVPGRLDYTPGNKEEIELRNLALVARLVARAALDRAESRGAHYRSDFPDTDDKNWQRHQSYQK